MLVEDVVELPVIGVLVVGDARVDFSLCGGVSASFFFVVKADDVFPLPRLPATRFHWSPSSTSPFLLKTGLALIRRALFLMHKNKPMAAEASRAPTTTDAMMIVRLLEPEPPSSKDGDPVAVVPVTAGTSEGLLVVDVVVMNNPPPFMNVVPPLVIVLGAPGWLIEDVVLVVLGSVEVVGPETKTVVVARKTVLVTVGGEEADPEGEGRIGRMGILLNENCLSALVGSRNNRV